MWNNKKTASCVAIALVIATKNKEKKKRRWMKEWFRERNKYTHENLLSELRISEPGFNIASMDYSSNVLIKSEVVDIDNDSDSSLRIAEEIDEDVDSRQSLSRTESSGKLEVKQEEESVDGTESSGKFEVKQEEGSVNVKSCYVWLQENPVESSQLLEEPTIAFRDDNSVSSVKRKVSNIKGNNKPGIKKIKIPSPIVPSVTPKEQTKPITDEFDALGVLWGSKLRKLEETQKILAEDLVNQILIKGFFRELSKNTTLCKVTGCR